MTTANLIKGNWHYVKGEIRRTWGDLTEDDLERTKGNTEALIGLLQLRLGVAQDEAKRKFEDLMETLTWKANESIDAVKSSAADVKSSAKEAVKTSAHPILDRFNEQIERAKNTLHS